MPKAAPRFSLKKTTAPRHQAPDGEYRAKTKPWYGTAEWKRRRAQCLDEAKHLCCMCLKDGKVTIATVADHIEPHKGDPVKFWTGALQALCTTCHNSIKKRMENEARRHSGVDGWPVGE